MFPRSIVKASVTYLFWVVFRCRTRSQLFDQSNALGHREPSQSFCSRRDSDMPWLQSDPSLTNDLIRNFWKLSLTVVPQFGSGSCKYLQRQLYFYSGKNGRQFFSGKTNSLCSDKIPLGLQQLILPCTEEHTTDIWRSKVAFVAADLLQLLQLQKREAVLSLQSWFCRYAAVSNYNSKFLTAKSTFATANLCLQQQM